MKENYIEEKVNKEERVLVQLEISMVIKIVYVLTDVKLNKRDLAY